MSFINQLEGIFSANVPVYIFNIYTNAVTNPAADSIDNAANVAITFNSLKDIAYKKQVNVAYEPLENSQFSSDSLQQTPYTLFLTGIAAPFANSPDYTNDDYLASLTAVINQLEQYLLNTTLLTIIQSKPLFTTYPNLKLTSYSYDLSPDRTNLKAYLTFQEVRIVDTTQYGTLPQDQLTNPANASAVPAGNQATTTPSTTTSATLVGPPAP